MTVEEGIVQFEKAWSDILTRMQEVHDNKRMRYTGGRDPLENYLTTGRFLAIVTNTPFNKGALPSMIGRLAEKLQRLATMTGQDDFLDPKQGEDETYEDTCIDLAVISILCAIEHPRVLRQAKEGVEPAEPWEALTPTPRGESQPL